ncbi:MAG: DUF502 domain-containing protein [bacterium]|nr:DUF502 domain-containing protein [bacterium]
MAENFFRKLRNIFVAGFLVILPVLITIFLVVFIFNTFERLLARPVSFGLKLLGLSQFIGYHIPGLLGLAALAIISFFLGLAVTNVIGKKFITLGEKILSKVPLVWNIYYASKQLMESTVSMRNRKYLQQVVLVEYPRRGMYVIGFITSDARGEIQDVTQKEVLNVFVPTTPNPTSGMLIMVPRDDVTPLSMSIEDGIKLIVSGGMVTPLPPEHIRKGSKQKKIDFSQTGLKDKEDKDNDNDNDNDLQPGLEDKDNDEKNENEKERASGLGCCLSKR